MFKKSNNPDIAVLEKSYRGRTFSVSHLKVLKIENARFCVWCHEGKLNHGNQRWCSEECVSSGLAWANPQSEHGLHILLVKQNFKCLHCNFDYLPYVEKALSYLNRNHPTVDKAKIRNQISALLMKVMKRNIPRDKAPEVDHIIPISKGGQAIGLDNVGILCYSCHKMKTKVDNSGPRKKK